MMSTDAVIIEAALNGVTTKETNPHTPRGSKEILADAFACLKAGAAIVHNHTDDPVLGTADGRHDPAPYLEVWRRLKAERPDVILYPTKAGGGGDIQIETRYKHILELADSGTLDMGLFDPGSVDFYRPAADGLPDAVNDAYINTSADIRYMFERCAERNLPLSVSIFEAGWLRATLAFHEKRGLPEGSLIKLYFGGGALITGLPPTRVSLEAYLAMLDGSGLPWLAATPGGDIVGSGFARVVLEKGGHFRVGLEDYAGPRTPTNEELVREAAALVREMGREPATCAEARKILGLRD